MKRYKTYALYNPSGVEWLGDIPEHWELRRLKSVITSAINGVWGEDPQDNKNDMVCIRVADFDYSKFGISPDNLTLRNIDPSQQLSRALKKGDLLIEKSGGGDNQLVGRVVSYNMDERAVCSNFIGRLLPNEDVNYRFLCYVFAAMYAVSYNIRSIKQTTGIQNLDLYSYLCEQFALPPLEEQQSLAAFLDCETTRIDNLITKKCELINLLQKKRTAIITEVITKGLNSKVTIKDSGIPWIGKIPDHWEIRRFKFMIKYLEQGWSPACENRLADQEEWGVLKVGCVNGGYFNELEHKVLPGNLEPKLQYEIKIGDILISRANTKQLLGSVAKVHSIQRKLLLCDKLYRLKTVDDVDPDFFVILLQSICARYQFERDSSGASDSMQNISQASMVNFTLPLPPLQEQKLIVDKLNQNFRQIDELKEKLLNQIQELQKYRQALITSAVTGKIDVRDEVNGKIA